MWGLTAGLFMGWSLGANDAANLFGPMVASGALRFRAAALLASVFVVVGAVTVGSRTFAAYDAIGIQTLLSSFLIMVSAGATVTAMTVLGLPVSSTQAVVGAIVGASFLTGGVDWQPLLRILVSWLLTPVGGMVVAGLLYHLLMRFATAIPARFLLRSTVIRIALVVATCYSAFSLGANNIANVTGVYVGAGLLSPRLAAILGAFAIGTGILTFSQRVISTVGVRLVELDEVTALIVVLAEAITLNVYAVLGVPVSASQAVVGAVLGIGLVKGMATIDGRILRQVLFGWVGTPSISGVFAFALLLLVRQFAG